MKYLILALLSYIAWLIVLLPALVDSTMTKEEVCVMGIIVALVITMAVMSMGS